MADPLTAILVARRLNSRDKALQQQLQHAHPGAPSEELTPQNIQALGQAIDRARTPQERAMLMQELEHLRDMASNLVGPLLPPEPRPGEIDPAFNGADVQLLPFQPGEQSPGVFGGQRMYGTPNPRRM